jgi:nicotinamide-nucleotide amidase
MFTAEIISIGDELTSGALIDTNSAFLSRELSELGIAVLFHTTVGDDLPAMTSVFETALSRSDLVLVTGGLGPTEDDLTRQAASTVARVSLVRNPEAMETIRRLFEIRGCVMPASNEIQSYFPEGARVIDNPHGTAPGFELVVDRALFGGNGRSKMMAYPGVPAELKEMWDASGKAHALDWEYERTARRETIAVRVFHTFGAGESDVESRLPHLIARDRWPRVGITASSGVITLRVLARGEDPQCCARQIDETAEIIYSRLGDLVYGEGDETLASVTMGRLAARGKRLATLEWGTHGLLAEQVPPPLFAGGLVESELGSVKKVLGLDPLASLEETLRAWQKKSGAEALLAVGPFPVGEKETPCEKFFVPVAALLDGTYREESFPYGLHPSIVKTVFVNRALNLLRKMLG